MQNLHGNVLREIADRLPIRDARRFGQTFAGARAEAAASLAARRTLDVKKDRAARTLVRRNRDIMAAITRALRLANAGPARCRPKRPAPSRGTTTS